jgi:hypothetical protein
MKLEMGICVLLRELAQYGFIRNDDALKEINNIPERDPDYIDDDLEEEL